MPPSRTLQSSISAAFASQISAALRRIAARWVCGSAAHAGWAAAAAAVAAAMSAGDAMPTLASSAPVAGSITAA